LASHARNRSSRILVSHLRDNDEFAALFDKNPDAVATYDTQGRALAANAAAVQMLGYRNHELLGESFAEHIAPECLEAANQSFRAALEGSPQQAQTVFVDCNGKRIDVHVTLCPVVRDGKVYKVHGIAQDITALRAAQQSLAHNEERFRSFFEQNPEPMSQFDQSETIVRANSAMEALFGVGHGELNGRRISDFIAPEGLEQFNSSFSKIASGEWMESNGVVVDARGRRFSCHVRVVPIVQGGIIEGFHCYCRDTTEELRMRRAHEEHEERLRSLYDLAASSHAHSAEQIDAALAFGKRSLAMDHAFVMEVTGKEFHVRTARSAGAFQAGAIVPFDEALSRFAFFMPAALGVEDAAADSRFRDASSVKACYPGYIGARIVVDGIPFGVLAFMSDTARAQPFDPADLEFVELMAALVGSAIGREKQERKLAALAYYDALTGLPNRVLLEEHLSKALAGAQRSKRLVAVHACDLDGFKDVNDTYGHAAGDEVLQETALRMRRAVRGVDTVARTGGDEFVIVQPEVSNLHDAERLARRLIGEMNAPMIVEGRSTHVGLSVGYCLYPTDAMDMETLLKCADQALYRAKRGGRARVSGYTLKTA